jgi:hypothetical protein
VPSIEIIPCECEHVFNECMKINHPSNPIAIYEFHKCVRCGLETPKKGLTELDILKSVFGLDKQEEG